MSDVSDKNMSGVSVRV